MHTDRYVCNDPRMSESSFFSQKFEKWWHVWSCQRCGDSLDKSTETRGKILLAAFEEIYQRGFQAASLSNILKNTSITKGALYHHFQNKMELGYAVIDEVIYLTIKDDWLNALSKTDDPITTIQEILENAGNKMTEEDVRLGCPLNNLALEMSPIDEGFRTRITKVYAEWQNTLEEAFERAKKAGNLKNDADSKQLAVLFVATLDGCLGLAKSTQSLDILLTCGHGLVDQLETLRPVK